MPPFNSGSPVAISTSSSSTTSSSSSGIRWSPLFSTSTFGLLQRSLDPETICEVLEYPGEYRDDEEEAECRRMVGELTPEEQHIIACTSHAYWLFSRTNTPSSELTIKTAMKEARRHLLYRSYERALDSLRKACKFRQERKVDLLRLCFDSEGKDLMKQLSEDERAFVKRFEAILEKELKRAPMSIRGFDKEQRVILHRSCPRYRIADPSHVEAYTMAGIFMVEKAMACSEVVSLGRECLLNVVMDYSGHTSSNGTPMSMSQAAAEVLRKNYPNRVNKIFVLDSPFIVRTFYTLLKPFLSKQTKEKLEFVNGNTQKRKSIGPLIDPEQATSSMLPDGKLSHEVDIRRSLYDLPFHALYDE